MADSFEKSTKRLQHHILGIKQLISNPDLRGLSEDTGIMGQALIYQHNIDGNYMGGAYENRKYSTSNLPIFFFGEATLVERTGNLRLSNPELNISNVLIKKEDIFWTKDSQGNNIAWLQGGYAKFLKYARPGKNLNKVDHQFTGAMLRNLTFDLNFTQNGSEVRWYVRSPHADKAGWTHRRREWMGFFQKEIDQIAQMAAKKFGLIIFDTLSTESTTTGSSPSRS